MLRALKTIILIAVVLFASSCANRKNVSPVPSIKKETKQQIAKPVNCATAKRDLAILEKEKASVGKRLLSGVRSVIPISAAAGILMGDYSDRVKVAVGTYNADLEAKAAQIRRSCRIRS